MKYLKTLGMASLIAGVALFAQEQDADASGFETTSSFSASIEVVSLVSMNSPNATTQSKLVVEVSPHRSLTITTTGQESLSEDEIKAIKQKLLEEDPFGAGEEQSNNSKSAKGQIAENTNKQESSKEIKEETKGRDKRVEVAMLLPNETSPEFNLDASFE